MSTFTPPRHPIHIYEAETREELQAKMNKILAALPGGAFDVSTEVTSPSPDRWIGTVRYRLPAVNFIGT